MYFFFLFSFSLTYTLPISALSLSHSMCVWWYVLLVFFPPFPNCTMRVIFFQNLLIAKIYNALFQSVCRSSKRNLETSRTREADGQIVSTSCPKQTLNHLSWQPMHPGLQLSFYSDHRSPKMDALEVWRHLWVVYGIADITASLYSWQHLSPRLQTEHFSVSCFGEFHLQHFWLLINKHVFLSCSMLNQTYPPKSNFESEMDHTRLNLFLILKH